MNRFEDREQSERRQFLRVAAEDVVLCEEYTIPPSNDPPVEARISNLSAGGILIISNHAYTPGVVLRLSLRLPGWEKYKQEFFKAAAPSLSRPLTALGTIVRVDRIDSDMYELAVSLSGMDNGHRQAVDRYIRDRLSSEKRQK
jgi:c-di-GMP-binding flagellar brake protein YcgR